MNNIYEYLYTGENVTVYVVDSGVLPVSSEFQKRLSSGISVVSLPYTNDTSDCLGHGTVVSSILGSTTYGVAKGVNIVPVKVFGCSDSTLTSTIIGAISWISTKPRGIVNLSLLGPYNTILNTAVEDLISEGFIVVVAAGNEAGDACGYSPSGASGVISVGSNPICKYIQGYGCRQFNFCGFRTKKQCLKRNYCKYSLKCKLK